MPDMGNRAQIIINDSGAADPVCLYTHWGGAQGVREWLAAALLRGSSRYTDPSYLTRIIFCEMVRGDIDGTTGFGIGTMPAGDSDYDLEVCVGAGVVIDPYGTELTFDEFIDHVRGMSA